MTRVLYFSAAWCRPCRSFGPLLMKELSARGVEAEKVDINNDHQGLVDAYGVTSVPAVVIERDGEEISRFGALLGDPLQDALSVLR